MNDVDFVEADVAVQSIANRHSSRLFSLSCLFVIVFYQTNAHTHTHTHTLKSKLLCCCFFPSHHCKFHNRRRFVHYSRVSVFLSFSLTLSPSLSLDIIFCFPL